MNQWELLPVASCKSSSYSRYIVTFGGGCWRVIVPVDVLDFSWTGWPSELNGNILLVPIFFQKKGKKIYIFNVAISNNKQSTYLLMYGLSWLRNFWLSYDDKDFASGLGFCITTRIWLLSSTSRSMRSRNSPNQVESFTCTEYTVY